MRLFQNSGVYRSYMPRLRRLTAGADSFAAAIDAFLADRFGAAHFLKPVLDGEPDAFFTNGDDEATQRLWAREQGLGERIPLDEILLAQIEHHRTEVFYNMDPMRYGDDFLARLPASVRRTVAWRAAPSAGGRFLKHDLIVNNFPNLLEQYRSQGARAEYFAPGHDPEMDHYAERSDRPIDVLFIGTYSRHHRARAAMLDEIASLRHEYNVVMHLDTSRYTKMSETPLGWFGPLRNDRRPPDIRAISKDPVFGRDLLDVIGQAKIVVNGSIDMAGNYRGNMRIWEALGCGAAMVSDEGHYPSHIKDGRDFVSYNSSRSAANVVGDLLQNPSRLSSMANEGNAQIKKYYNKTKQMNDFIEILS